MKARATSLARSAEKEETSSSRAPESPAGVLQGGDGQFAQRLDVVEQAFGAVLLEHLAQQATEQADVAAHRLGHLMGGLDPGDAAGGR